MAGSASTITYDELYGIHRVIIDWTSDASAGTVTAVTKKIVGQLLKVVTNPGTPAPTADYDIAITDESSLNVLTGLAGTGGTDPTLADRHTSNTEVVHLRALNSLTDLVPGSEPYVCDKLTVAVSAAGNSKQGQIVIYYRPFPPIAAA